MEKETVNFLLKKLIDGTLTESEKTELTATITRKQYKELFTSNLETLFLQQTGNREFDEKRFMPLVAGILKADAIREEEGMASVNAEESSVGRSWGKKIWWFIIPLIVLAAAAFYFFYYRSIATRSSVANNNLTVTNDVEPGRNKAVLTLSDGSTIDLDSAARGFLAQQGNAKVIKAPNGELRYNVSGETAPAHLFNTVTTPMGGQYQLILSDGSRVKLNSFSSITYPTSFSGKDRSVTITGEAYFEIVKNPKIPFKVNVYDLEVEAVGTQFNINAYNDEQSIKTTLLTGSVQLTKNSVKRILQPAEQGKFEKDGSFLLEKNIDTNEVMAWKNGMFEFNNVEVRTVLRQIARWYDVDIVYERGAPEKEVVFGDIRRNVKLSEVIKMLEKSAISCKIDGRKLIVKP